MWGGWLASDAIEDDRCREGRGVTDRVGRLDCGLGTRGGGFVAGMDHGKRHLGPDGCADGREIGQADGMVDVVGGANAATTELDHGDADGAGIDGGDDAGARRRDLADDRCRRQIRCRTAP